MLVVDDRGERPLLVLVTDCCGAKLWIHLGPSTCPMCGRKVAVQGNVERDLTHLKHHSTRYWS